MSKQIGVVGYGTFGKLMCKYLLKHFNLKVYDIDPQKRTKLDEIDFVSLPEILAEEIIIIAIPVQFQETFFKEQGSNFNPQSLVLDVSSVKSKPAELMVRYLPETTEILATHPLFGPNSATESLEGHRIVLCPVRIGGNKYNRIKDWLSKQLGLSVLEKTPEDHDRQMAYVQALTFLIGRASSLMQIPESDMNTKTYEHLLAIKTVVESDTYELFKTIQSQNSHAFEIRKQFRRVLEKIEGDLGQLDNYA